MYFNYILSIFCISVSPNP